MAFLKFLRFMVRYRCRRRRSRVVVDDGNIVDDGINRSTADSSSSSSDNIIKDPRGLQDKKDNGTTTTAAVIIRRFSWDEMESLTINFSRVIGYGGFSTVYLAHFPDSSLGAIKIHNSSERLNRVFKQELEILLHLHHHNIVKLLGYSHDREKGALVFEYIPNGSLQEKLHGHDDQSTVLSWKNRMAIAFQLVEAIEYLHEKCKLQIVHGDIKASNILLDDQLDCKLCDFGFAKMGFSSMVMPQSSMMMMGSPGYIDPHYLRTGLTSKKNDVYSFGVIVLELITGIEAFCSERGQLLTTIAGSILISRDDDADEYHAIKVVEMMDPRLAGDFDLEEARAMASISAQCLRHPPTLRPSATDILRTMKQKISSISFLSSPADRASSNLSHKSY